MWPSRVMRQNGAYISIVRLCHITNDKLFNKEQETDVQFRLINSSNTRTHVLIFPNLEEFKWDHD